MNANQLISNRSYQLQSFLTQRRSPSPKLRRRRRQQPSRRCIGCRRRSSPPQRWRGTDQIPHEPAVSFQPVRMMSDPEPEASQRQNRSGIPSQPLPSRFPPRYMAAPPRRQSPSFFSAIRRCHISIASRRNSRALRSRASSHPTIAQQRLPGLRSTRPFRSSLRLPSRRLRFNRLRRSSRRKGRRSCR